MNVSIIGTGNIGSRLAGRLAAKGIGAMVASSSIESATAAAEKIGGGVRPATVEDVIAASDIVVLAVWFAQQQELLAAHRDDLAGKTIVDPANNISFSAEGEARNENPEGLSAAAQISALVPDAAHYVKAFGSMSAEQLEVEATDAGEPVVMFEAYDDEDSEAGSAVADLIRAGGWVPVRVGDVSSAGRIEVFGDLHPFGGLEGRLLGEAEAADLI